MDTRTAELAIERSATARREDRDVQDEANAMSLAEAVTDQTEKNWENLVSSESAKEFVSDWIADPVADLAAAYQEYAKVKIGLVCIDDAARIVFRAIERSVISISTTQVERKL